MLDKFRNMWRKDKGTLCSVPERNFKDICVCMCVWDLKSRQWIDLGVIEPDGLERPIVTVLNNSHPCAWGQKQIKSKHAWIGKNWIEKFNFNSIVIEKKVQLTFDRLRSDNIEEKCMTMFASSPDSAWGSLARDPSLLMVLMTKFFSRVKLVRPTDSELSITNTMSTAPQRFSQSADDTQCKDLTPGQSLFTLWTAL